MRKRLEHLLLPLLGVVLFGFALWILRHELRQYRYRDIIEELRALRMGALLLGVLLTALNYAVLTGYDALALRYLRRPLAYPRIALASFVAYAFAQNLGLPLLTGSSVRYRLYSAWGLTAVEIAQAVAFTSATFFLGLFAVGGATFLLEPLRVPALAHLPIHTVRPLGLVFLALVVAYLVWGGWRRAPIRFRDWEFKLPGPGLMLSQLLLSSLDWILAAAVLYAVLPPTHGFGFPTFLAIFLFAQITGLISHVPGGLGVFEAVILVFTSPAIPADSMLGSLLAYRAIYYLLPLVAGALSLGAYEASARRREVGQVVRVIGRWVTLLAPHVLAITTFVGGAILLFSGATPAVRGRLSWLNAFLPLPIIEVSHLLGSLVGVALLVLAWGLQRRLDAAYHLAVAMLSAGIVLSLLKGLDYEEATALAFMLAALVPARREFYRKASLTREPFTPGWIAAIGLMVAASIWLGFFSYKHVDYTSDLWWRFALQGDAPRFLRASVAVLVMLASLAALRLLRTAPPEPARPGPAELARALTVIRSSPDASAALALLGDKTLLFSETGNSFVMYGVEGRSWVVMGDPVGDQKEKEDLVWQFRELVHRHDGWPVFYQVSAAHLPLCLDLGLTLQKLGEKARVPLEQFHLEGGGRKNMRYQLRRLEKEGAAFEVVPRSCIPSVLPDLRRVSDAWLAEKNTREKGFSLGFFDEDYLRHFAAALVRRDGDVVAFANLWEATEREEISVDLMRYSPQAPANVMEFLFVHTALWAREQGYHWFDLGMAPLAGLENRALAPLWNRVGALIFRHGDNFYNFQGLRAFKQKFDPVWEPRYLASPGGLVLPRVLANLAALVSGGLRGMVAK